MLLLAKFYLQTNKLLFAERVSGSFFVLFRPSGSESVRQSLTQLQQDMEVDAEHVVETKEVTKEDKEKKEEEVDPTDKVYVGFTLEKIPVRHPVSTKSAPVHDRQTNISSQFTNEIVDHELKVIFKDPMLPQYIKVWF